MSVLERDFVEVACLLFDAVKKENIDLEQHCEITKNAKMFSFAKQKYNIGLRFIRVEKQFIYNISSKKFINISKQFFLRKFQLKNFSTKIYCCAIEILSVNLVRKLPP